MPDLCLLSHEGDEPRCTGQLREGFLHEGSFHDLTPRCGGVVQEGIWLHLLAAGPRATTPPPTPAASRPPWPPPRGRRRRRRPRRCPSRCCPVSAPAATGWPVESREDRSDDADNPAVPPLYILPNM